MRFVAGRGAEAERMAGIAMAKRMAALWQRAIGKMLLAGGVAVAEILLARSAVAEILLAGALQRRAIGKMLLARAPPWQSCWPGRCGRATSRQLQKGITTHKKKESDP